MSDASGMKAVRWISYARKKIALREIDATEVEQTLANPERVVEGAAPRQIYMRRYHDVALDALMLLRVVVEPAANELVVATVYKTSKVEKYLKGIGP